MALTTLRGRCAGGEYARIHDRDRKRVSGEVARSELFLPRLNSRRVVVEGLNDHAVGHEHGACHVLGNQIVLVFAWRFGVREQLPEQPVGPTSGFCIGVHGVLPSLVCRWCGATRKGPGQRTEAGDVLAECERARGRGR